MAGVVGGGGLGDIAIRYGYNRYQYDIMLITVILLVVLMQVMQFIRDEDGGKDGQESKISKKKN